MRARIALMIISGVVTPPRAFAADEPNHPATPPSDTPQALPHAPEAKPEPSPKSSLTITPVGYVEANYSYNFNRPSNGITNYLGFDNRHNTFTLSNVALGANVESDPVEGRLVLQVGSTPSTYYLSEPSHPGAAGANASDGALWKYIQEAWVAYKAPIGRGLRLQLGVWLSPVGPEAIPIKENWNWSRSNLFFGLPFYHAGFKATYDLTDRLSATAAVYNGWNDIVDNNDEKSPSANITYKIPDLLLVQVLYLGGVERPTGSPDGPYWRHLFDGYIQWDVTSRVAVLVHGDGGWEYNRFGLSDWYAGALASRVKVADWLFVALRGDRFWEDVGSNSRGRATPIFWPVGWVSSGTATLDVRPHDHVSVRLEYRHDQADGATFFRGTVAGAGSPADPYVPNANAQDTMTLGVTGWL